MVGIELLLQWLEIQILPVGHPWMSFTIDMTVFLCTKQNLRVIRMCTMFELFYLWQAAFF